MVLDSLVAWSYDLKSRVHAYLPGLCVFLSSPDLLLVFQPYGGEPAGDTA